MAKIIIGVQVESDLNSKIEEIAVQNGLSKSALIRLILLKYIKQENISEQQKSWDLYK